MAEENKKERTVKPKFPDVNTALHIVKGAIVKILHTPLTTTTDATKKSEGRITVEYKLPTPPTQEQLNKIEELANEKIKQNVEIKYFPMKREEAEEKYRKNPVNETFIYDKFPAPAELKELKICEIPDWNVNCTVGPLLGKTGEIRPIKIKRTNHRANKGELEFIFELVDQETTANTSNKSDKGKPATTAAATTAPSTNTFQLDDAVLVGKKLVEDFFAEMKAQGVEVTKEKEDLIRPLLEQRAANKLSIMKNTAYSRGFAARLTSTTSIMK
eukprot:TRINITY_DN4388_c0_g1_i1.p1 TRINITY_DN4388_c0_g1~~TRINITY_DN4388_c0_g1_i1.p1  ORF type:complete len:282 (-),score=72.54 TRINITY_DN4388_c0_g1_i1:30-845(-)